MARAANVTDDQFRAYLNVFHETLQETAAKRLEPNDRSRLRHLAHLPAHVIGYVSTQHGVAIEYRRAAATKIEVVRGSSRVEDLLVGAPGRISSDGVVAFPLVDCPAAYFAKFSIEGVFPFRIEGNTDLTIEELGFRIGAWSRVVEYAELYTDRRAEFWTEARAVERAKEEIIAALVDVGVAHRRREPLDSYIANIKERTVLLLGDYGPEGRERLARIKEAITSLGYNPILVEDIPDDPHLDLSQKVVLLGTMARFVFMDDSSPSGHLAEFPLCRDNRWVTVILREFGRGASAMTAGAELQSNAMRELPYDPAQAIDAVRNGAEWAEQRLIELKRAYRRIYPWRSP